MFASGLNLVVGPAWINILITTNINEETQRTSAVINVATVFGLVGVTINIAATSLQKNGPAIVGRGSLAESTTFVNIVARLIDKQRYGFIPGTALNNIKSCRVMIITTGIDLSVGSLIALSGVIVACSAREFGINPDSGLLILFGCVLLGIVGCGLLGTFSGVMVTAFGIHPFIVTLSIMSIARGMSFIIANGPSDVVIETESYRFLGAGRSLMGIPNSVILMMLLYVLAHLLMTRTVLGRHIYAVGGNREAAHLSGVPVKRVLIIVYTICGALAGLGGVVNSSLHGAGSAKSGMGYELQIIAAVVVGGTSLAGGSGNIMGTLVGALILGVIANGMNLTGVTTYPQMVVFGLLILVAVLIDQLKNRKTGAASS